MQLINKCGNIITCHVISLCWHHPHQPLWTQPGLCPLTDAHLLQLLVCFYSVCFPLWVFLRFFQDVLCIETKSYKTTKSLNSGTKPFIAAILTHIQNIPQNHSWILSFYCTILYLILSHVARLTCTSSLSLVILWKGRMRNEVNDRPLTRGWFSSEAMASRNAWFPSLERQWY